MINSFDTTSSNEPPTQGEPLLSVCDLVVEFDTPEGRVRAVDHVSFDMAPGETLGLVGESGCGKSVTSLSLLGLIPSPPGRVRAQSIRFGGRNLPELSAEQLRRIRGREISMIFQEPMTSLNPVLPVGRQVAEPLMVHRDMTREEAYREALQWLQRVKIPSAAARLKGYPHEMSGGMRQRVMIAMAMVCRPKLLIADEPTTALDVTIQAQILSLMTELRAQYGMGLLLITHDLGVVAQMAHRVVVMYAGEVMEQGGVLEIFESPFHPYTEGLLQSMPRLGARRAGVRRRLQEIPGVVPALTRRLQGCKFAERCPHAFDRCRHEHPPLQFIGTGHAARCHLGEEPDRRRING